MMLGGSILIVIATYLSVYYDVLGKIFPNEKMFPDSETIDSNKK